MYVYLKNHCFPLSSMYFDQKANSSIRRADLAKPSPTPCFYLEPLLASPPCFSLKVSLLVELVILFVPCWQLIKGSTALEAFSLGFHVIHEENKSNNVTGKNVSNTHLNSDPHIRQLPRPNLGQCIPFAQSCNHACRLGGFKMPRIFMKILFKSLEPTIFSFPAFASTPPPQTVFSLTSWCWN